MSAGHSGNETEARVLAELISAGFHVLVPFGDGHPFDLVVHLDRRNFLRVQCKTARSVRGCAIFNSRTTDHGRGRLSYAGRADIFGVYLPSLNTTYLVPVAEVPGFQGHLRLRPTRNNQKRGVKFAQDYEIAGWSRQRLQDACSLERGLFTGADVA